MPCGERSSRRTFRIRSQPCHSTCCCNDWCISWLSDHVPRVLTLGCMRRCLTATRRYASGIGQGRTRCCNGLATTTSLSWVWTGACSNAAWYAPAPGIIVSWHGTWTRAHHLRCPGFRSKSSSTRSRSPPTRALAGHPGLPRRQVLHPVLVRAARWALVRVRALLRVPAPAQGLVACASADRDRVWLCLGARLRCCVEGISSVCAWSRCGLRWLAHNSVWFCRQPSTTPVTPNMSRSISDNTRDEHSSVSITRRSPANAVAALRNAVS